ncbi:helix-turn-helix domain-containing protein, partial [Streptomyces sp. NPDC088135]|uniref:helix-turn-helix domain-containing protein n=1 Tax=Streptomyces sp. NPDC088135 TaxID=3160993 RepID=UPI0034301755
MTDEARRRVLAEFLRTRRDRVQPADAGIPAGPRRRTPGLRREEVAVLSGVSVTWYTWLEQAFGGVLVGGGADGVRPDLG